MNFLYGSENIFVEFYIELSCLLISGLLLYLYYRNKINIFEILIFAIATDGFALFSIGPTLSTSFFVTLFFFLEEVFLFLKGKRNFNRKYLLILFLPLFSSIFIIILSILIPDLFYFSNSRISFFLKPLYFYFKFYLPFFAIGSKIISNKQDLNFQTLFQAIKRVCKLSLIIATLQIVLISLFHNTLICEIFGTKYAFAGDVNNGNLKGFRVQAFFIEPKILAGLLSLAIPIFLKDKEYKTAILCFVIAILTQSQTFFVNLFCAFLVFILISKIYNIRVKILGTFCFIFLLFLGIASIKTLVIQYYLDHQENQFLQIVAERAIERYNPNDDKDRPDNLIFGLPLEVDTELPVFVFFAEHSWLIPFGYGPGNSSFINPSYFVGLDSYDLQVKNSWSTTYSMRWFFIIVEFGLIYFIYFFIFFTKKNIKASKFENNFFVYIWICWFFSNLDMMVLMVLLIYHYSQYYNSSNKELILIDK